MDERERRKFARSMVRFFSRMRVEHPDFENFQIHEASDNGRVKVRKPHWETGKYITVPAADLRHARGYAADAGVVVGYEQGNRQLPYLARTGPLLGLQGASGRSHRGAWQQMESIPELTCLAWLQCEMWDPMAVDEETLLINLGTYGRAVQGEGEPLTIDMVPYHGHWGGIVVFQPLVNPRNQIAALAIRIDPEGDPEDPDWPDEKAKLVLYCVEPDTLEVQWVAEVPGFMDGGSLGGLSPNQLHHDPYNRVLVARGSSTDEFAKRLYVFDQDGNYLASSNLGVPMRNTAILEDWAIKCWWELDESDPETGSGGDSPSHNLVIAWRRNASSYEYHEAWSFSPKSVLGLPEIFDPPYTPPGSPVTASYQQSFMRDEGGLEDDIARFPYSVTTRRIAFFFAGHTGLNYDFTPFPLSGFGTLGSTEDRSRRFEWDLVSAGDPTYASRPHYRPTEAREVKMSIAAVNLAGAVDWVYKRSVEALEAPLLDQDILDEVTPRDPLTDNGADWDFQGYSVVAGSNLGWATHGQMSAIAGTSAPRSPHHPNPNPAFPFNRYKHAVPDYRVLASHDSEQTIDFELHPAGLVNDPDGGVVFAIYEPYQILVPGGTNGVPIASAFRRSTSTGNYWYTGATIVTLTGETGFPVDPDEDPETPPKTDYELSFDYAGVLQQQCWKKTILIRLNPSGGVEWAEDISCYSDGYDWAIGLATGHSTLDRPHRLDVRQIIPFPELSRLVIIRQWRDDTADPPKPEQTVIEVREWGDASVLYARIELSCDPDGVVLQFDEETIICYDFGDPGYPHDPAGEGFCDEYGTFAAGAYKWVATYDTPAKGAMTPDGKGWIALTGSGTDRTTDGDFRRLVRILIDLELPDPVQTIEDLATNETRVPNGGTEAQSLAIMESGAAVWHNGFQHLVATIPA